jgi:catechol 2,3-dioxygenase-like lactoylglutathione lyase family enzyme
MALGAFPEVARLACISLSTGRAATLIDFYERAFGFHFVGAERHQGARFEGLMGVRGGAIVTTLGLGEELIEIVEFDEPGAPYPKDARASDLIFQHLAIVVSDIKQAYQRLLTMENWTPISMGGPQLLPAASGGVSAYKFRDPEGHPLEFLAFPSAGAPTHWADALSPGPCLGVDHTAISVASGDISRAFYEALGLHRSVRLAELRARAR